MKDTQENITDKSRSIANKILEDDRVLRCEIFINEYDEEFLEIDVDITGTTLEALDELSDFIKASKISAYINYMK